MPITSTDVPHEDNPVTSRQDRYIIKALPVNVNAKEQRHNEFIMAQFIEFRKEGFVLQMTRPLVHSSGRAALGPCMIEVSEILTEPT